MVSGIGFVFFKQGRKKSNGIYTIIGVVMMVYPYLITDTWLMLGIGAGLCAILYFLRR